MIVGYARVSSINQKLERQLKNLIIFGIENRPIFQEALNFVKIGNQFVMKYIDHLGRTLKSLDFKQLILYTYKYEM